MDWSAYLASRRARRKTKKMQDEFELCPHCKRRVERIAQMRRLLRNAKAEVSLLQRRLLKAELQKGMR